MTSDPPSSEEPKLWKLGGVLLLALPAAALGFHPLANNDLPLHLAIGEWVVEHGIPATDPFSFTARGAEWVPHEWLAGVFFHAVEHATGAAGLIAVAMLLAGLCAVLTTLVHRELDRIAGRSRPLAEWLPTLALWGVPVWLMLGPRVMARPHLIAYVLLLALAWLLLRGRSRPGALIATVPLLALWGNLHGSFPLAIAIVGLDLGLSLLPRLRRHEPECWAHGSSVRSRVIVGVAVLATPLLHLHVYQHGDLAAGLRHAFGLVSDPVFSEQIAEWQSPFASQTAFRGTVGFALSIPFLIVGPILVARAWIGRVPESRAPHAYWILVLATLALYCQSQRFLALYVLTLLPVLPTIRAPKLAAASLQRTLIAGGVAIGLTILLAVFGLPHWWDRSWRKPGTGWTRSYLAFDAVDRLVADGYAGGVLCEYHYGGSVIWRGGGALAPTMDSRNTVYGAELYQRHQLALEVDSYLPQLAALRSRTDPTSREQVAKIEKAAQYLEELLERVGAAVLRDPQVDPRRLGLHRRLVEDPQWQVVGGTAGGALLYRKSPQG